MPEMTLKALKKICIDTKGYGTPDLNEILYLNHRGFTSIAPCIQEYSGCKVVWLQNNAIFKIENLGDLPELKSLFLHENGITKVEGLEGCPNLDSLNLASNPLEGLQGVSCLKKLTTLDVQKCTLKSVEDIQEITQLPELNILNLTGNNIADPKILDVLKQCTKLKVLYLKGNPFIKHITSYRKRVLAALPNVTYLDDRPVFEDERRICNAWARDGRQGEQEERDLLRKEREEKNKKQHEQFKDLVAKRKRLSGRGQQEERKTDDVDDSEEDEKDELPGEAGAPAKPDPAGGPPKGKEDATLKKLKRQVLDFSKVEEPPSAGAAPRKKPLIEVVGGTEDEQGVDPDDLPALEKIEQVKIG